jgi:hypothetical protein
MDWFTAMWIAWAALLALAVTTAWRLRGVAHHQQHHCGIGHDLGVLLVALQDAGIVLPEELVDAADWHREHALAYGEQGDDDEEEGSLR